ncbi:hypothetical protein CBS101457_003707 [Exobasidium rhododendri]|nr:hypothetical protein CBS101457_003707 [Exobasidium rhododendri]
MSSLPTTGYSPSQSRSRATGTGDASHQNWSDVERQSGSTTTTTTNNSSDIVLQGRSYRFQNLPDNHHAPFASSYTATSGSIRDSTALLAGMAFRSDDESDKDTRSSRIDELPEEEDLLSNEFLKTIPVPNANRKGDPTSSSNGSFIGSQRSNGPSNLSKAINASQSTSPATLKAVSSPGVDVSSPMEALEDTPLLGGRKGRSKSSTPSKSRETSQTDSISSAQRERDRERSAADSAISVRSSGAGANNSSTYGYGALARASLLSSRAQHPQHVTFAESDTFHDDVRMLPLAWAFVPPRFRPGKGSIPVDGSSFSDQINTIYASASKLTWKDTAKASMEPIRLLPAVILGLLLNILDGVSYGLIIFPTSYPIFSDFGGDGVSMFFVTCVISQLVFSLGGSIFKGGNGSMMIEVVPFYHILVTIIIDVLGDEDPAAVVSTTITAFALSSIFAGIVFLALGYFRLGVLVGFFPRHILVGCIGGVGVFLIETGLEVSSQLKSEEGFQWNLETLRFFTQSWGMVAHWLPALGLAILLRVITSKFHQPLIFPAYFLCIPIVFYIVTAGILRIPLATLKDNDWVFDVGKAADAPFWRFYTYFDVRKTSWKALWATMPTQLALTFFSILHVPLNVPALAVSVNEDNLDTDRELLAHGISNIAAGLAGSVPNYLCYVNSVLFYRVGGGSRLSGLMLAGATFCVLLSGPGAIGYLPICVVGALIFVLGIDLTKEAVWDTIGRVNSGEYFTIWLIIFVMTYYDFVVGIISGIIVACLFFVIQTSRRRTVRAVLDGSIAKSTVRRHTTQRHFLEEVGQQSQVVKLQGFLYFANISKVEELIRRALDIATWQEHPIRFLIVDFSLVNGVDFSAAEAFTRIQRLLQAKDVVLVFCGLTPESEVGIALRSVDLWTDSIVRVEVFQSLNEALEWTENEYLHEMYASGIAAAKSFSHASLAAVNSGGNGGGGLDIPDRKRAPAFHLNETMENSPRRRHLYQAAQDAAQRSSRLQNAVTASHHTNTTSNEEERGGVDPASLVDGNRRASVSKSILSQAQPLPLLMITFQAYAESQHNESFFKVLVPFFQQILLSKEDVLWKREDESDGLYLIEAGILRARYDFPQEDYEINEAMLAGTIAGELSFLSKRPRNTTAYADLDCKLWKLDAPNLLRLKEEQPSTFNDFLQLLLRACTEEQEGLMSYLVSRLS